MEKITQKITITLSLKDAIEYNELVERDDVKKGIPTESRDINRCPKCGRNFGRDSYFCGLCGQRVKFVDSDVIPL